MRPCRSTLLGDAVGGWLTDFLFVKTGNVKFARRSVAISGMLGSGGGARVLDRAVRDRCLPAVPRRRHLSVLDRSEVSVIDKGRAIGA
jgi:hypothetical protein